MGYLNCWPAVMCLKKSCSDPRKPTRALMAQYRMDPRHLLEADTGDDHMRSTVVVEFCSWLE